MKKQKKISNRKEHYTIEVKWPKDAPPPRMQDMQELFFDTGVKLDENYGPMRIHEMLYAVRATASEEAKKQGKHLPGVKFILLTP